LLAAAATTAVVPATSSVAVPHAAPAAAVSGLNAKGPSQPPPKFVAKRTATKTNSRLAIQGAPALTTPEASSSGGARLLQSLGFDFEHTILFILTNLEYSPCYCYQLFLFYQHMPLIM
jgi:hypothetical protein